VGAQMLVKQGDEEHIAAAGASEEVGAESLVVERELAVDVRPAGDKGLGVFACEACEAGRWICNYEGELLTEEEFQASWPVRLRFRDVRLGTLHRRRALGPLVGPA
jgi:hypothetical protein